MCVCVCGVLTVTVLTGSCCSTETARRQINTRSVTQTAEWYTWYTQHTHIHTPTLLILQCTFLHLYSTGGQQAWLDAEVEKVLEQKNSLALLQQVSMYNMLI